MIVCHQYQFIFIKTKKTAGTSLEIALSRYCSNRDIITPISPADEQTRAALGGKGPRNYLRSFSEYSLNDWKRLVVGRRRAIKFYNHMSASLARARLCSRIWRDYYKFCVDRNPWDRVISLYHWRYRNAARKLGINAFILDDPDGFLQAWADDQESMYRESGRILVDRVVQYENLQDELPELARKLQLPSDLSLPNSKSTHRKDHRRPTEVLNASSIERIRQLFSRQIELFGYSVS